MSEWFLLLSLLFCSYRYNDDVLVTIIITCTVYFGMSSQQVVPWQWNLVTYIGQKHHLNTFHLPFLRRILGFKWQDHITNSEMLSRTGTPSMHYSQSAPTEMARACSSNGWWTHPQGISIRTIEDRSQESRAPGSAVQGREQTWPQSMRNSSKQLWRCLVSSCLLETVKEWDNYESWRKTSPERWREARSPQK